MSTKTEIQWTDTTWNPIRGCSRVSPGCGDSTGGGCYAERQAHRFSGPGKPYEGLTRMTEKGPRWTGKIRLVPESLDEPLRWRKPQRIFVNSMSDLFHADVPDEFIAAVYGVMECASQHTFQVLTKRPERMRAWFAWIKERGGIGPYIRSIRVDGDRTIPKLFAGIAKTEILRGRRVRAFDDPWMRVFMAAACNRGTSPLANVHLGVSVENQEALEDRIGPLCETPAAVRFLSCEPLLGPLDFTKVGGLGRLPVGWMGSSPVAGIDWVIVGGESGPGARPCDVAWIRSIVAQCKAALTPCFVKQRGSLWYDTDLREGMRGSCAVQALDPWKWTSQRDRKGGDPSEWPEDLRVREFPAVSATRRGDG